MKLNIALKEHIIKNVCKTLFASFGDESKLFLKERVWKSTFHRVSEQMEFKRVPLFDAIFFETRTICNSSCSFCASSMLYRQYPNARPDTLMPLKTFEKALNDLAAMNYLGRIAFHVNNDPLLDKRLVELVKMTRQRCPHSLIHILTNGIALTNRLGKDLLDNGVGKLEINNYSDNGTIRKNIQVFMGEVAPLYPNKQIIVSVSPLSILKNNRAGSNPFEGMQNFKLRRALRVGCTHPFTQFNVTTDGSVSICCNDVYFKEKMGNINDQTILDIWNGKSFKELRKTLLNDERTINSLCAQCDIRGFQDVPREFPVLRILNNIVGSKIVDS